MIMNINMDAKEVIEQYENLFAWEQKEVKQHIMGNIDIKETMTDIVYDFQSVCSKIEDLDYNLGDIKDELKELKEQLKNL